MLETGSKIGPLENVVGEEVVGYKYTHPDFNKKVNANVVLHFKSGKKLFISSMVSKSLFDSTVLFLSPEDENAHKNQE